MQPRYAEMMQSKFQAVKFTNNQSESSISALQSYATVKFIYDIGSWTSSLNGHLRELRKWVESCPWFSGYGGDLCPRDC